MQLEDELAGPVPPELPLSPELAETPSPPDSTSPVSPESAAPEVSVVSLPEPERAGPEEPPAVPESAVELPELPEVEVVVGSLVASPVPPEEDSPPAPLTESTDGGGSPMRETLWGLASEFPDPPELFEELLVELAAPVPPVVPEVVSDPVVVAPEVAEELEVAEEDTAPLVPPFPELPEVALGSAVAEPEDEEPVFPLGPLAARSPPSQPAS